MECVAYLRVSTEKQAEEGNGTLMMVTPEQTWTGRHCNG